MKAWRTHAHESAAVFIPRHCVFFRPTAGVTEDYDAKVEQDASRWFRTVIVTIVARFATDKYVCHEYAQEMSRNLRFSFAYHEGPPNDPSYRAWSVWSRTSPYFRCAPTALHQRNVDAMLPEIRSYHSRFMRHCFQSQWPHKVQAGHEHV
jgi:hypothetical protein